MAHILTVEEIQNFKGKYPKQLWYLFFSEMWERFSFYGMRGMVVIFMVRLPIYSMEPPKPLFMLLLLSEECLPIKF